MNRHSETGLKLIKSSQYVEDSIVTNGPDLGPKLDADFVAGVVRWKASQGKAKRPTAPSFTDVLFILKDRLAVSRHRLAETDRAHVANVRHFLEVRALARSVNTTFFSKMSATRRTFQEHFPDSENAFVLAAFQSPTSADSTQLLEQAGTVLDRLESPTFVLPKPLTKAVKVDPEELITELKSEVEQLRTSDNDLRLARRKVQKSRKDKNRAVKEHSELFLRISRMFESFYLIAGEPELAAQIRPSGRRPGRRAVEVADEEAAGKPDAEQSAPEQSAPEQSAPEQSAVAEQVADSAASNAEQVPAEAPESDSESSTTDASS
ncbi:MAG: hypothetical protein GY719_06045 [bacterium]|nr:hypothetical protein [bacterium]